VRLSPLGTPKNIWPIAKAETGTRMWSLRDENLQGNTDVLPPVSLYP
jgi:hypothetical protein